MTRVFGVAAILALGVAGLFAQGRITKDRIEGISNLSRLETTVACAGATTPTSMAEIRKMGFKSVINLRQATEPGINLESSTEAAKSAGLKYIHIPFSSSSPDPASVDAFLKAIREPGAEPAFIHCASGNRAAAMWMIKRVLADKWDVDKASAEAAELGLSSQPLKTFALDYIQKHR